jgi:cysteine desulfurase
MQPIYLDHNATSPLRPEARRAMDRALDGPAGNPSSLHAPGRVARILLESAREQVARLVGARREEIVLTAGGTEANNLALYGAAALLPSSTGRVVTSAIEHPSVLEPLRDLERRGVEVLRVAPTRAGVVEPEAMLEAAAPGTGLVSLMLANNEVGTLQPIGLLGQELRRRGVLFHCDAAQAPGKVPIDAHALGVDLLSIAGHKFGGPQGTGALYVRQGVALRPHLRGGGQELNRRPGTENIAALAGLGAAAEAAAHALPGESLRMRELRDRLEREVLARVPASRVNGGEAPRVPNTSNLAFAGLTGEILVMALDLEGIAVSAGSACSAGTVRKSHVLEAMGLGEAAGSSIRISLGPGSTAGEIDCVVRLVAQVVDRVRAAAVAPALRP